MLPVLYIIGGSVLGLALLILTAIKCSGLVVIGDDENGVVTKAFTFFGKKELPAGRSFALEGEPGVQADMLSPGWHFFFWPWQYSVQKIKVTIVPEGQIGLVVANDGTEMPMHRTLADYVECDSFQNSRAFLTNGGQKGKQIMKLRTGMYRINTRLFTVITSATVDAYNAKQRKEDQINPAALKNLRIAPEHIGIVTIHDGAVLPVGIIAAPETTERNAFQDEAAFIKNGGFRGLQETVLMPGTWVIHPWFATVEVVEMTHIPAASCGVVVSFVGDKGNDVSGVEFQYGDIVPAGHRGVWATTLGPGMHPINTRVMQIEIIPTSNFVLNWSEEHGEHGLDNDLGVITLRSRDGFDFTISIQQIIHVPPTVAPMLISRFKNMQTLVGNVLEPLVGNYFRNISQKHDMLEFISTREARQQDAKAYITQELRAFNVEGKDTLIGDLLPPAALMKTLQDRKLADEMQVTIVSQTETENKRAEKEKATAMANSQADVVTSSQAVVIAERRAEASRKEAEGQAHVTRAIAEGNADAKVTFERSELEAAKLRAEAMNVTTEATTNKIKLEGQASMEVRRLELDVVGQDNYAAIQIAASLSGSNLKLVPDIAFYGDSKESAGSPLVNVLTASLVSQRGTFGRTEQAIPASSTVAG